MLEAGWPAHYATYTGRSAAAILADLEPIEQRILWDEPQPDDCEAYTRLAEEWNAQPREQDRVRRIEGELTALRAEIGNAEEVSG
jgi:hypothetical protein